MRAFCMSAREGEEPPFVGHTVLQLPVGGLHGEHKTQHPHVAAKGGAVAPVGVDDHDLRAHRSVAVDEGGELRGLLAFVKQVAAHDQVEEAQRRVVGGGHALPVARLVRQGTQVVELEVVFEESSVSGCQSLTVTLAPRRCITRLASARPAPISSALPAVATQDWCDRAAQAVLPLAQPSVAVTMIGQIDDRGAIIRQEATGVAGAYVADVTTNVGKAPQSAPTTIHIDPNDANLVQVRTNLAQAREIGWMPGALSGGVMKAGAADRFGVSILDPNSPVVKRWNAFRLQGLLLGVASIGPGGRVLIIEMASSNVPLGEHEAAALDAVLPLLAKRAVMALGTNPSEASHWLTAREQIILQHLLLGKSVREIAEELGRSPHTVHDHVKSLHRKLNASSRGELVARALGYTEPPALPEGESTAEIKPTIYVRATSTTKPSGQTA